MNAKFAILGSLYFQLNNVALEIISRMKYTTSSSSHKGTEKTAKNN